MIWSAKKLEEATKKLLKFFSRKKIDQLQISDKELVELAGSTVVGTTSGLKAQHAQAELTRRLMDSIKSLDKTTSRYSNVLVILTVILVMITIYQFILFLRFQLPLSQLEAQQKIQGVIENCKIDSNTTWFDPSGKVYGCSEIPKQWLQKNEK